MANGLTSTVYGCHVKAKNVYATVNGSYKKIKQIYSTINSKYKKVYSGGYDAGTLTFTSSTTWVAPFTGRLTAFIVNGGNGGSTALGQATAPRGGSGGGGGFTRTVALNVVEGQSYPVVIGSGGNSDSYGGTSSFGTYAPPAQNSVNVNSGASGGGVGGYVEYIYPSGINFHAGNGGSDGGYGYINGSSSNGANSGQGVTTRFNNTLYGGGGGGGAASFTQPYSFAVNRGLGGSGGGANGGSSGKGANASANTGGGGGGGAAVSNGEQLTTYAGGKGGSGIIIITWDTIE